MKFAFVEGTEVANAFSEVVPNDEAMVLKGFVHSRLSLFVKSTKMAVQSHVCQEYLPSEYRLAFNEKLDGCDAV